MKKTRQTCQERSWGRNDTSEKSDDLALQLQERMWFYKNQQKYFWTVTYAEKSCNMNVLKAWSLYRVQWLHFTKGQLILKYLFGVFKFFKKMNENKSTWDIIVGS